MKYKVRFQQYLRCVIVYTDIQSVRTLHYAVSTDYVADFIKGMGTYLGFIIGIYIEKRYVNFSTEGNTGNKIIRVLLGIVILLVLQLGLKVILPSGTIFSFIRYALISLIGIGVYPMIFKKFKF